ncbi:hypothetical protein [Vibrio neptunius]|uniref:hypothetical protein n=1 Tax=Vibrio neptunius TaxID=170651 RepID=UPI00214E76C8|nr:hypothetical protein [Vibrio neptunius]
MENLDTRGLKLRLRNEGDADFIQSLYNTEGFLRFVGDKHIRSRGDAVEQFRNMRFAIWFTSAEQYAKSRLGGHLTGIRGKEVIDLFTSDSLVFCLDASNEHS